MPCAHALASCCDVFASLHNFSVTASMPGQPETWEYHTCDGVMAARCSCWMLVTHLPSSWKESAELLHIKRLKEAM